MALLWLRFALACYFIGLIYAFFALSRTSDLFSRIALHAASLGMVFHFVSLVELFLSGHVVWASVHNGESLLAFFSMTFFMIIYAIYQTTSPGVVVFPIVFFLTFVAAVDQQPVLLTSFVQHKGWLIAHIILIFTGYAALVLSFGASLLYLLQERRLKAKKPSSLISFLPALEVIDQIGYRSLLLGFPFMTLGLITGSVVAMSSLRAHRLCRSKDSVVDPDVGCLHDHGLHPLEFRMAWPPCRGLGDVCVRGRYRGLGRQLFLDHPQVCRLMRYQLIGVNHKSAPLEVRERLAIPESRLPDRLPRSHRASRNRRGHDHFHLQPRGSGYPHHQRLGRSARISARSLSPDSGRTRRAFVRVPRERRGAAPLPRSFQPGFDGGRRSSDSRPGKRGLRHRPRRGLGARATRSALHPRLCGRQARAH